MNSANNSLNRSSGKEIGFLMFIVGNGAALGGLSDRKFVHSTASGGFGRNSMVGSVN